MRAIIPTPEARSPYNVQRLPPPHVQSDLGLPLPLPTNIRWLWLFALIPAAIYGAPILVIALGRDTIGLAAFAMSLLLIVAARYVFGVRSLKPFVAFAVAPALALFGGAYVLDKWNNRAEAGPIAAAIALVAVLVIAFDVAAFYRGYILADETVPAQPRPKPSRRPIIAPLVAVAQAAYLLYWLYSSPVALAPSPQWYAALSGFLTLNFAALALSTIGHHTGGPSFIKMIRGYLTYGSEDPGAGGVWRHRVDRSTRVWFMSFLVAAVSFAVPLNLQWFRGHNQQLALDPPASAWIAEARTRTDLAPENREVVERAAQDPTAPVVLRTLAEQRRAVGQGSRARPLSPLEAEFTFIQAPDPRTEFATTVFDEPAFRKQFGLEDAPPPPPTERGVDQLLATAMSSAVAPLQFLWQIVVGPPIVLIQGISNIFAIVPFLLVVFAPLSVDAAIAHLRSSSSSASVWENITDRVALSKTEAIDPLGQRVKESDHIYIGRELEFGAPVLLHRTLLNEHCYIVGDSGSGKTSLGIMPMLIQLVRSPEAAPIVILDLKGDSALFNTAREEATLRGKEFRFFTLEKGQPSNFFNPFLQYEREFRTDIQVCQLLLDSLSLNHGEGYGRGYYSKRNRRLLLQAIEHPSKPQTFADLYNVVNELAKAEDYKEAFELIATIEALTKYPQLGNASQADPEQTIHFPTTLAKRQLVYFWLPAAVESVSAREISKLALFALLSAAIDRPRQKPTAPRGPYYVFIDEFQRLAGENFKIILEQARSFGLSAVLANQSVSDLKTPDTDLRPTVQTNTRVKFFFSIQDAAEARALSDISGEEIVHRRSWSQTQDVTSFVRFGPVGRTESVSEAVKPRLSIADIRRASDHPNHFAFFVSRGSGLSQFGGLPIVVSGGWPMSFETYRRRRDTHWPKVLLLPPPPSPEALARGEQIVDTFRADDSAWNRLLVRLKLAKPKPETTIAPEDVPAVNAVLLKRTQELVEKTIAEPGMSREMKARFLPEPVAAVYQAEAVAPLEPKDVDAAADRSARDHRANLIREIIQERRQREGRGARLET